MKKRAMKIMACMLACAAVMGTASESAAASTATAGVTSYTSNIVSTFNLPSAGVTRFLSETLKIDETVSVQIMGQRLSSLNTKISLLHRLTILFM